MELRQPFYNHEGRATDIVMLPNLRICDTQKTQAPFVEATEVKCISN